MSHWQAVVAFSVFTDFANAPARLILSSIAGNICSYSSILDYVMTALWLLSPLYNQYDMIDNSIIQGREKQAKTPSHTMFNIDHSHHERLSYPKREHRWQRCRHQIQRWIVCIQPWISTHSLVHIKNSPLWGITFSSFISMHLIKRISIQCWLRYFHAMFFMSIFNSFISLVKDLDISYLYMFHYSMIKFANAEI